MFSDLEKHHVLSPEKKNRPMRFIDPTVTRHGVGVESWRCEDFIMGVSTSFRKTEKEIFLYWSEEFCIWDQG